jgi:hypothetical protein
MAECETAATTTSTTAAARANGVDNENEDVNGNLEDVNGKSIGKDEPDDENSMNGDDNEMEPGEINFNHANALEMHAQQAAAASAAMSEANAIFNNAAMAFQPGMSMQTFQNAIAQFTANAIANNMDNETVMKNLAILQSALFTLQQQQFLQFQLIQHLQSQLVGGKKGDGSDEKHNNNKSESDDEDCKMKEDIDEEEEDGELEEIERQEQERQTQIHKRLMESKHFSKMQDALMKESDNR